MVTVSPFVFADFGLVPLRRHSDHGQDCHELLLNMSAARSEFFLKTDLKLQDFGHGDAELLETSACNLNYLCAAVMALLDLCSSNSFKPFMQNHVLLRGRDMRTFLVLFVVC